MMTNSVSSTQVISNDAGPRALVLQKSRLMILNGEHQGDAVIIDRPVFSLGAGVRNDLVLDDPFLSRNHCEIENTQAGYLLRDLGSTNGTFIKGVRIREAFLAPGAEIRLGNTRLSFSPLSETKQYELSSNHYFGEVQGCSIAMRRIFCLLETFAPTDTTILIEGETGTGKELLAEAIHQHSPRARKPFVVIDCGALSSTLVESELFGHARGAFTGAAGDRMGAFEQADGGTVFLDEIGELSSELQPKLLRVLEKKEVRRLGTNSFRRIDVRILSATNRRLEAAVNGGQFREDLYYRLAMMKVDIPPLRHRRDDIPRLVDHFLETTETVIDRNVVRQRLDDPTVQDYLVRHAWPGNVRELRNFVHMLSLAAPNQTGMAFGRMEERSPSGHAQTALPGIDLDLPYKDAKNALLHAFESRYLSALLDRHHWNISQASRAAGIERAYLQRLTKKLGLIRPSSEPMATGRDGHGDDE